MAPPSNILAWRIQRAEEPGGLQAMGSKELDMTLRLSHRHHFRIILSNFLKIVCIKFTD